MQTLRRISGILKWFAVIALNAIVCFATILLQVLYYGTAPEIDYTRPFKDDEEKSAVCTDVVLRMNKPLLIAMLIGAVILFALNFGIIQPKTRRHIWWCMMLFLLHFLSTGLSLTRLSIGFIDRNMASFPF